jgi:hypothetical protein
MALTILSLRLSGAQESQSALYFRDIIYDSADARGIRLAVRQLTFLKLPDEERGLECSNSGFHEQQPFHKLTRWRVKIVRFCLKQGVVDPLPPTALFDLDFIHSRNYR